MLNPLSWLITLTTKILTPFGVINKLTETGDNGTVGIGMDWQETQHLIATLRRLRNDLEAVKPVFTIRKWDIPASWFALRSELESKIVSIRTSMMYCKVCQFALRRPDNDRCPICKLSGTMIVKGNMTKEHTKGNI